MSIEVVEMIVELQEHLLVDDKGLAKQLGCSPVSVWRARRGKTTPRLGVVVRLTKLWRENRKEPSKL